MNKSSKKRLGSEIKALVRKIKKESANPKAVGSMLDELISLQKQYDVEPTELIVPVADVVTTYDFDAFQILKCKQCIIFKCAGYRLIAKPLYNQSANGGALYEQLSILCDMKDNYEKVDDETKELYSLVFNMVIQILSLPIDAFVDDEFLFDISKYIVEKKTAWYKRLMETPLKEESVEDIKKNQEFEIGSKELAELTKSIKEKEKEESNE